MDCANMRNSFSSSIYNPNKDNNTNKLTDKNPILNFLSKFSIHFSLLFTSSLYEAKVTSKLQNKKIVNF